MKKRIGPTSGNWTENQGGFCSLCCASGGGDKRESQSGPDAKPRMGCFKYNCCCATTSSLDRISDVSKSSTADLFFNAKKSPLLGAVADAVCLIQHSPFRILRVAEQGNVTEFGRLISADPAKLNVRDGKGRAAIHQATIRNHVNILEIIVRFNGDLDLQDIAGNCALHLAIEADAVDAIGFLLANGANPNLLNQKLQAPLHISSELNKIEALKVISKFKNTLDPNLPGEHGRTALHIAAINDHEECMKTLLYDIGACPKRPCKHGFFPIHEAAKHASSGSMEILLRWGETQGNCPRGEMISFFDAEGNVPLHSAVHGGDLKAVELCLRSGAKISTAQHDLSTPVHLACSQGSMEIIKLMFQLQPEEKEMCLKSCDIQRKTALHYASMFDHHALVELLIQQGASVNALDKEKRTPLLLAASRNGLRTIKSLINSGANLTLKDNEQRNFLHTIVINGGDLDRILEEEYSGDFLAMLDDKDQSGFTPLHYAAKLGHIKTAAKLLQLGASISTKNNEGRNVFHIACKFGRLQIVQRILKMEQSNSVINEGDGRGLTTLHISSSEGHVRVVQALIKKGALLHRDHSGRTPLHYASSKGHRETMKLLLNVHSQLLDQTDKDENTPLHVAAMENQPMAVDLLLSMNCSLSYNSNGFSATDFALHYKFTTVALAMVTHKTRGDEVLSMTGGKHPSIVLALIAKMPQVMTAVLDNCIKKSEAKSDSEHYHIKYDFKWLSLVPPCLEPYPCIDPSLKTKNSWTRMKKEMKHLPILNGMVSYGRVELLSHDLSQKYLQMKWDGYGRLVHVTQLTLYMIFLSIVTTYASQHTNVKVSDEEMERGESTNLTEKAIWGTKMMDTVHTYSISEIVKAVLIFSTAVLCLFREGINIWRQKWNYILNSSNWVFWGMNTACVVMTTSKVLGQFGLIHPSASLATFLCWFYLLLFLQRFEVVGIYVVMFLEILHTLIRVLMIFSILIVAFGLAFYILLSSGNHRAFNEIPISLLRTFSMMLGDTDFLNTFVYPHFCGGMLLGKVGRGSVTSPYSGPNHLDPQSVGECGKTDRTLPHPISSFLMFVIFMVLMPILLMNLLIGLAVGDIESVRRNAQLKRLAMQVSLHTSLEKTLPEFILRLGNKTEVIEYPNTCKTKLGLLEQVLRLFQPKTPRKEIDSLDEEATDDLVTAVTQSNYALQEMSTRIENLETLMRLLCHKMELSTDTDFIDEGTTVDDASLMSDMKTRFKRGVTLRLTKPRPQLDKRSESTGP